MGYIANKCIIIVFVCTLLFVNYESVQAVRAKDSGQLFQAEMLPWDEVKKLMPKGMIFRVIDIESGLSFDVQMRAGSKHADVQPLTSGDTKILRKIYAGKWSWKRRPIIVVLEDRLIAASMNGMPHGAGAIKNNFPGHFCIHFYQSKTHTSNETDLAHQLMVYKAAGRLDGYLQNLRANEIVEVFIVAINQQDYDLMAKILAEPKEIDYLRHRYQDIASIKLETPLPTDIDNLFFYQTGALVSIYENDKKKKKEPIFILKRLSLMSGWEIDIESSDIDM